jgi:hypothetical protein
MIVGSKSTQQTEDGASNRAGVWASASQTSKYTWITWESC